MAFLGLGQTYLGNTLGQYVLFFLILIGAVAAGKLVTWISKTFLKAFASKTKTKLDDTILHVLEGPVLFTIFILALTFGKDVLTLSPTVADVFAKTITILWILNGAWYLVRLLNSALTHYVQPMAKKSETDLDDHMLPLLQRLIKIVIVAIVAIMIIEKLGYDVSTLVAGLGLGGLAFALAAQDLLGNFFGGLAILTDKPFKVGDRLKIGTDVDGFVREIGLRTTRLETLASTMIVVPNRKVVDAILVNVTREKARQIIIDIGVEYGTSVAKLEQAKKLIEKNIKAVKGLDHETFTIAFSSFGDFALNLKVIFWITKEGMDDYFGVQDKLNMGIKKDFEKAKIEMAFPTQTVYVRK